MADYYYFRSGGKWKYHGVGVGIPIDGKPLTHDKIKELNGGKMPGIISEGKSYMVVVIDPDSFPRFVHAEEE